AIGAVTTYGNSSSHEAVLMRMSGIPAIINITSFNDILVQGDHVVLDGDRNMLFKAPSQAPALAVNRAVDDASFGVNIQEYREKITSAYLTDGGDIKSDYTYEELLRRRIEARREFRRIEKEGTAPEAFLANLRQHFVHDLLTQRAQEAGKQPWELNDDIEINDLLTVLEEERNPEIQIGVMRALAEKADPRAIKKI